MGAPKTFSLLSFPIIPSLATPTAPLPWGWDIRNLCRGTCLAWDIPLRTLRGTCCWPKRQKHPSLLQGDGQGGRRPVGGEPGWHKAEPCWLLLPAVPVGPSLAPGHRHRPRAAPRCGDEMKHSGYRSEVGGERLGHRLAPTCAEVVRKIYRGECEAFSFWLYNNTLSF